MSELVQRKIRGYELRELIGTGGFGVVYRAYQPAVEREVAIKAILPIHANDPEFVRRFEREARFIARLEHLHIIPIYDYWREPQGAYLVMRYLKGGNLLTSIQQGGPWDLPDAARMVDQIAAALMTAHQNGIIHQDLKPENILLDADKNAYLSDFGIAKEIVSPSYEPNERYGSPGYASPEQIIGQEVTAQSDIYSLSLVIYAMLTGEAPFDDANTVRLIRKTMYEQLPWLAHKRPDLPKELDRIIRRGAAKDPAFRYPDTLSLAADFRAACALPASDLVSAPAAPGIRLSPTPETMPIFDQYGTQALGFVTQQIDLTRNPFKGLQPFDETDAADFFGRDDLINRLIRQLNENDDYARFLAVVGPSGSGKSSVVRAGLLPALRRGLVTGSERWFTTLMNPGQNPLRELEEALLRVAFQSPRDSLYEFMQADEDGLVNGLQALFPPDAADVLIVIDQFEEVFSPAVAEEERTQFLKNLIAALHSPQSRLRVIITLRADFYDRPLLFPGFGDLMYERTAVVLPMTPEEMSRAIVSPTENAGLMLEDGLADMIGAEIREQPGGLPLLQFALTELYERRDGTMLTLRAYEEIGGVAGALVQRADDLYTSLFMSKQLAAQQMFLRLVTLGEGVEDTRRRVLRHELLSIGDRAVIEEILDLFGKYRLLTFDRDPVTRAPTVEIAHEALIRQWRKLRDWLENSRDDLRLQVRLAAAAAEWVNAGRDSSFLAAGSRLAQFETVLDASAIALTPGEREYLEESIAQRRRRQQRRQMFTVGLVLLTLLAVGLAIFAFDRQNQAISERDRADEQASISHSRFLAIAAAADRNRLDESLRLSLEAVNSYDTVEARRSLLRALQSNPRLVSFMRGHTGRVYSLSLSPDGRLLATGGDDGRIILYDTQTYQPIGEPLVGHSDVVGSLAFSPDGARLASGGYDDAIVLWDVRTPEAPTSTTLTSGRGQVLSVAFSPDGAWLAAGGTDAQMQLWDLTLPEPANTTLTGHDGRVYSVAFSPDGIWLASGDENGQVMLRRLNDLSEPVMLEGQQREVFTLAFSADSSLLAAADSLRVSGNGDAQLSGIRTYVMLWDVANAELLGRFETNHTDVIQHIAFSPGGNVLATASHDNSIYVWDLNRIQLIGAPFTGHTQRVWDIAFNTDGSGFYSAGWDSVVIAWRLEPRQTLARPAGALAEQVNAVAFSPDGRMMAAGGGVPRSGQGAEVRLWALDGDGRVSEIAVLDGYAGQVSAVAFSRDGRKLAVGSEDTTVQVWDVTENPPRQTSVFRHDVSITGVAFSPDGTQLAAADLNGGIRLLLLTDNGWQPTAQQLPARSSQVAGVAFSPDGDLLAAGYHDQTVILWDMETFTASEPLAGHMGEIESVAFSLDGRWLATGSRDNTVRLWDVATRQPWGTPLMYHANWVMDVAFSPDGRWLASASRDNRIMLWDVATAESLQQPLIGHSNWVTGVQFSPDSQTLLSGSWDKTVLLWDLSLQGWTRAACAIVNPAPGEGICSGLAESEGD